MCWSELRASLLAQMVKNLSAMWETQVWSLDELEFSWFGYSLIYPYIHTSFLSFAHSAISLSARQPLFIQCFCNWCHHYQISKRWKVKGKCYSLSPVWLFATQWTVAHQVPLSMRFSRQEYWRGLLFPTPGNLSPGSNLGLLHCKQIFFNIWAAREAPN